MLIERCFPINYNKTAREQKAPGYATWRSNDDLSEPTRAPRALQVPNTHAAVPPNRQQAVAQLGERDGNRRGISRNSETLAVSHERKGELSVNWTALSNQGKGRPPRCGAAHPSGEGEAGHGTRRGIVPFEVSMDLQRG